MSIQITFGNMSLETFAKVVEKDLSILDGDILFAMNQQKSRILARTARGVDINEVPFPPYSTNGPFYWYPNRSAKNRAAATKGTHRKLGGAGAKTRLGIRFDGGYAQFKQSLGRSVVDLMGSSAPHMLQAMIVKTEPGGTGVIGIYGPEADRATGHNVGNPAKGLPRREFFGFGMHDADLMAQDVDRLMAARARRLFQ